MKKECAAVRKSLRKYLQGHLFKYEQVRIARHLNSCPVCRSEFQALKKVADTKQLLKEITPPESLGGRVKQGMFGLSRLKLLFYRPLWLLSIVGMGTFLYLNVIAPVRHDVEIENIEKTIPDSNIASVPTVSQAGGTAPVLPAPSQKPTPVAVAASTQAADPAIREPLVITITAENEKAAADRLNEIFGGHSELRTLRFTDSVKEVSGRLTSRELTVFFSRIEGSARVQYSKKKFDSFPAAEPVPFVLKLKQLSRPPAPPEPKQAAPEGATVQSETLSSASQSTP